MQPPYQDVTTEAWLKEEFTLMGKIHTCGEFLQKWDKKVLVNIRSQIK